jgi:hypothetical protein
LLIFVPLHRFASRFSKSTAAFSAALDFIAAANRSLKEYQGVNTKLMQPDHMKLWAESIGGFIINFGVVEHRAILWVDKISGRKAAIKIRSKTLSDKIKTIQRTIPPSKLSDADKNKAHEIWKELAELAILRNRLAHNPIIEGKKANGEFVLSIMDINRMGGDNVGKVSYLDYQLIARATNRVAGLIVKLDSFTWNPINDNS